MLYTLQPGTQNIQKPFSIAVEYILQTLTPDDINNHVNKINYYCKYTLCTLTAHRLVILLELDN